MTERELLIERVGPVASRLKELGVDVPPMPEGEGNEFIPCQTCHKTGGSERDISYYETWQQETPDPEKESEMPVSLGGPRAGANSNKPVRVASSWGKLHVTTAFILCSECGGSGQTVSNPLWEWQRQVTKLWEGLRHGR